MLTRTLDYTLRALVGRQLRSLPRGRLRVRDPWGTRAFGDADATPTATLTVHDRSLYRRVVPGGSVAFGEAYMDGLWSAQSLDDFLELMALNRDFWSSGPLRWLEVLQPLNRLRDGRRKNSRSGSRQNIAEHYDLGDDLYRCFLDETMTYSAAFFEDDSMTLAEAQRAKLDLINEKLNPGPGDHVLELGCGWGSYALRTARTTPARITAVTLSANQYEYLSRRVEGEGLADRVNVVRRDYRDLEGSYDRIVSVEMLEAVGEEYWDVFFGVLERHLKPGGRILLQTIHIRDRFYESYRKDVDFIRKHIFPGGFLPGLAALLEELAKTSLVPVDLEEIGGHYARTLEEWKDRFLANRDRLPDRFDEAFVRGWEYYLAYCRAGFSTGVLGDAQLVLDRPDALSRGS